jgi:acetyl-CoA carboxylase carboxyltransferase component
MCGKTYDRRLIFAWPSAELAVMGGTQAAKVLAQIEASSLKKEVEKSRYETKKLNCVL